MVVVFFSPGVLAKKAVHYRRRCGTSVTNKLFAFSIEGGFAAGRSATKGVVPIQWRCATEGRSANYKGDSPFGTVKTNCKQPELNALAVNLSGIAAVKALSLLSPCQICYNSFP